MPRFLSCSGAVMIAPRSLYVSPTWMCAGFSPAIVSTGGVLGVVGADELAASADGLPPLAAGDWPVAARIAASCDSVMHDEPTQLLHVHLVAGGAIEGKFFRCEMIREGCNGRREVGNFRGELLDCLDDVRCEAGMSRFLLNIEKRSLPRLMLSGDGLASKDAV